MNHEFEVYASYPADQEAGALGQDMQKCKHCGMKIVHFLDGTTALWVEMLLEKYPDCDMIYVASVMDG